ncbi:MAG: helix-turn-helix domain-containing protein [Oscillospiraceae bacterium]
MKEKWLSPREVAAMLDCGYTTVTRLITAKRLKAVDIGAGKAHHWRIRPEDVAEFLKERSSENTIPDPIQFERRKKTSPVMFKRPKEVYKPGMKWVD